MTIISRPDNLIAQSGIKDNALSLKKRIGPVERDQQVELIVEGNRKRLVDFREIKVKDKGPKREKGTLKLWVRKGNRRVFGGGRIEIPRGSPIAIGWSATNMKDLKIGAPNINLILFSGEALRKRAETVISPKNNLVLQATGQDLDGNTHSVKPIAIFVKEIKKETTEFKEEIDKLEYRKRLVEEAYKKRIEELEHRIRAYKPGSNEVKNYKNQIKNHYKAMSNKVKQIENQIKKLKSNKTS